MMGKTSSKYRSGLVFGIWGLRFFIRIDFWWGQIWSQESVGTVAISPSVGYENPRNGHKNIFETGVVCLKREITISQCEGLESAHQHVHLQIWVLFFKKKPVNTPYSMGVSVVSTKKTHWSALAPSRCIWYLGSSDETPVIETQLDILGSWQEISPHDRV